MLRFVLALLLLLPPSVAMAANASKPAPAQPPASAKSPPPALAPAQAEAQLAAWRPLVDRLVADGFPRPGLVALFSRPEAAFSPKAMTEKIKELFFKKYGSSLTRDVQRRLKELGYFDGLADGQTTTATRMAIKRFEKVHKLELTGKPTEALLELARQETKRMPAGVEVPSEPPGPPVFRVITTPERLAEAVAFYNANRKLLAEVEATYGVPADVAVGLLAVETRVGTFLGEAPAFQTLASMVLSEDLSFILPAFRREQPDAAQQAYMRGKVEEKGEWAYKELKALLRYAAANKLDVLSLPGSVYGAIGIAQFMPSSALKFGVDGDRDGDVDLFTLPDALHSMGNFLKGQGWKAAGGDRAKLRKVLYRYNPMTTYVNTILFVADHVKANAARQP